MKKLGTGTIPKPKNNFDLEWFKEEVESTLDDLGESIKHYRKSRKKSDQELVKILTSIRWGLWKYARQVYNGTDALADDAKASEIVDRIIKIIHKQNGHIYACPFESCTNLDRPREAATFTDVERWCDNHCWASFLKKELEKKRRNSK